jgi:hypothetical protein
VKKPDRPGDDEEKRRQFLEAAHHSYAVVMERLEQLLKKGVICQIDLENRPVVCAGRSVPKILATIERLLAEKHLAGIEKEIEGFCYVAGMGLTQDAPKKK